MLAFIFYIAACLVSFLVLPLRIAPLMSGLLSNSTALQCSILIIFGIIIILKTANFTKMRLKKRYFINTLYTLVQGLNINYGILRAVFQQELQFDIRKIRKFKSREHRK